MLQTSLRCGFWYLTYKIYWSHGQLPINYHYCQLQDLQEGLIVPARQKYQKFSKLYYSVKSLLLMQTPTEKSILRSFYCQLLENQY